MASATDEYIQGSSYRVSIEGMEPQMFDDVSGIGISFEDIPQQAEKGLAMINRPGRFTASDITLNRRLNKKKDLWDWVNKLKSGKQDRRSGSIVVLDDEDKEVIRYNFTGAWPKDWRSSNLSKEASGNATMKETVTLSVQDLERV